MWEWGRERLCFCVDRKDLYDKLTRSKLKTKWDLGFVFSPYWIKKEIKPILWATIQMKGVMIVI